MAYLEYHLANNQFIISLGKLEMFSIAHFCTKDMFSTVVLLQVRLPSSNSWSKIRVDSPGQLDGVIVDLPLLHTHMIVAQLLQGGHL